MHKFKSFLKLQDYFGMVPQLNHHGKMKYQNLMGAWISLIINFSCIIFIINYLVELFSHNNPSLNTVTISSAVSPNITLSTDDLIIAFGIMNRAYKVIDDPSIFTIVPIYQIIQSVNNTMKYSRFPMKRINCTEINMKKYIEHGYEKEFLSNDLQNYFCYNVTEDEQPIIIGGNYGSEFYGVITLSIMKCDNSTSGGTCKTNDEIDAALNLCYFEVFFLDHFIDVYNYKNPIQTYSQSFYYQIDPKLSKFLYSYFNPINLFSDNGIIYSTEKEYHSFKEHSVTNDVFSLQEGEPIAKLWVMSSYVEEDYYRSYIKLPEICGSVGGLLKGLQMIGIILYSYFEIKLYYKSLINSIFEFRNKERKPLHNLYRNKSISSLSIIKKDNITIDKTVYQQKIVLNLSPWQHVKLLCGCGKKKADKKREYDSLLKCFNRKIEFSQVVLCQNEIGLIKDKLYENKPHSNTFSKFKWNIWSEYSFTQGSNQFEEKSKAKTNNDNDSTMNRMTSMGGKSLSRLKYGGELIKTNNYFSKSSSLVN